MPTRTLTLEVITAAILGFEEQKRHIDSRISELKAMLSGGPAEPAATPEAAPRKRKKFSAATRRKMKEAQQRRWAKIKGEAESSAPAARPAPSKPKRKLSAAGRAAIIAATKKRWALQRAEAAKARPAAAKKSAG
ncbi:MAG: hypothetical protein ABSG25_04215 [Bryobacteraceae bacterium]